MAKALKILGMLTVLLIVAGAGLLLYVQANQQTIIAQVKEKLNERINGELNIGGLYLSLLHDFPQLSLSVRDFSIKDSAYRKEVFVAERIYLRLNLLQLITRQLDFSKVTVTDGRFFLLLDSSGYVNTRLMKVKRERKGKMDFDLKEVELRHVHLSIHEEGRGRHMSFTIVRLSGTIPEKGQTPVLHLKGLMKIDSMLFKPDKGAFFVNKLAGLDLNVSIDNDKRQFVIHPSRFEIDKQAYDGKGYYDFTNSPGYLHLEFSNPKTNYIVAKEILSEKIQGYLKDIVLTDSVEVKVVVKGLIGTGSPPDVDASFNLTRAKVVFSGITLTDFTVRGLYMNHVSPDVPNDEYNSALKFDVPFVKLEGIPVSAQVTVTDLKAFRLAMSAKCQASLTTVNHILPDSGYRFTEGNIDAAVSYRGVMSYYMKGNPKRGEDTLDGYLKIKSGSFSYSLRKLELKNINTDVAFDQRRMDIKDLSGSLNGNQLTMKGYADGVTRLISDKNQKMVARLTLNAPQFDLSKVLTEKNISDMAARPKKTSAASGSTAAKAIDQLIDDITLQLNFSSNLFTFRKFKAREVRGDVTVSTAGLHVKDFKLNSCGGDITVNGGLNTTYNNDKIEGDVEVNKVNVKEFMRSADNFSQQAITHENLNGNLSAKVYFYSPLDATYTPLTDSMVGRIFFSLKGGSLTNFEPLQNIGKFIFKKRDFAHITFDEISDSVTLKGLDLSIHRMEIASSVFRLFIQGHYRVNGGADLSIQFPLSNLKKQEIKIAPSNIGTDAEAGPSIFLRVKGGGKEPVRISFNPAARHRLKKEKEL